MEIHQGSAAFKKEDGEKVKSVNIEKVTQFEFYDQKAPMNKAVSSISTYLNGNL